MFTDTDDEGGCGGLALSSGGAVSGGDGELSMRSFFAAGSWNGHLGSFVFGSILEDMD